MFNKSEKYRKNLLKNGLSEYKVFYGTIEVCDNVFIGANSIIMPNVKIGKNVIIGAGSVVTKDVNDDCIVAGVPAKVVGNTDDYAKKILDYSSKIPNDIIDEEIIAKVIWRRNNEKI